MDLLGWDPASKIWLGLKLMPNWWWEWMSGAPLDYTPWKDYYPDRSGGLGDKKCGQAKYHHSTREIEFMNTYCSSTTNVNVLCEL